MRKVRKGLLVLISGLIIVLLAADVAQIARALCEERVLAMDPAYREYQARVRWRVVLFRNGTRVASRAAVTRAPSGSFEARFVSAGAGRFVAAAAE